MIPSGVLNIPHFTAQTLCRVFTHPRTTSVFQILPMGQKHSSPGIIIMCLRQIGQTRLQEWRSVHRPMDRQTVVPNTVFSKNSRSQYQKTSGKDRQNGFWQKSPNFSSADLRESSVNFRITLGKFGNLSQFFEKTFRMKDKSVKKFLEMFS